MQIRLRCNCYESRIEKAKVRLLALPRDDTYSEAKYLLGQLVFVEDNKGRTSGSRVKFYRAQNGAMILLHKPHPSDIMNYKSVRDLAEKLTELGDIS